MRVERFPPVHGGIADHPDDALLSDNRRLEAVVGGHLGLGAADELERVVKGLAGRPGQPWREIGAIRLDQSVQLPRVGLIEQPEVHVFGYRQLTLHRRTVPFEAVARGTSRWGASWT
jgi:hypothetical protein